MGQETSKIMITDIQRFSLNDGPGIRTTVFLKGCPLRCTWCHNPETQSPGPELMYYRNLCLGCEACAAACPNGSLHFRTVDGNRRREYDVRQCLLCGACVAACPTDALKKVGRQIDAAELLEVLWQDREYLTGSGGGVTFSGGEPLMQAARLAPLLKAVHDNGYNTAIDTAGCVSCQVLDLVLDHTDLFLYDIKTMDAKRHEEATGDDNKQILANLARLVAAGKSIIIRVPVIPGFNDTEQDILDIAAHAASLGLQQLDLLPFHAYAAGKYTALGRSYRFRRQREPDPALIGQLAEAARVHMAQVRIEQH